MAPMPSSESESQSGSGGAPLSPALRRQLIELAWNSIRHGMEHGRPLPVSPKELPAELQVERACFVTLEHGNMLRGCIGHLEAIQPLAVDVAENAFAAAFRDPRFPPLARHELEGLSLHLSILTPARPLPFDSEADLIARMRPGIDGLILSDGHHRGTFLPSVWEQLPEPRDFLRHLKQKAGLSPGHWSPTLRVERYETESFSA